MTLWIREVADDEIRPRVPFGAHSARPAEALGFRERGLDVGNADLKVNYYHDARERAQATKESWNISLNYNIYGISFHIPPLCLNLAAMRLNVCTLNHGQVFIVGNDPVNSRKGRSESFSDRGNKGKNRLAPSFAA